MKDDELTVDSKAIQKLIPDFAPSPKIYFNTIKEQILGNNGSMADLIYFLQVAKRTNLDPTIRQIYAIFRWDKALGRQKMSIQTGVDGLRSVAERTGYYAGSSEAEFTYIKDGQYPDKARITVYKLNPKTGERMPTSASAKWSEYKPSQNDFMWKKMPETMLSKCAEAKALRKAFPVTQGLYSTAEMNQADDMAEPKKESKAVIAKRVKETQKILDNVKGE